MPAFVLLARENRAFWANMATAAEYLADVLSFMSGYGNILKAGKLVKLFKAGEKLILKSKTFTKIAIGARNVSGYLEMTAGVGNALLKLTNARETELGKKISEVLFYLEMAALTGELTAALSGSIKKASQKALENTAEVNKIIKQAEETLLKNTDEAGNLKQIEEVLKAQDDLAAIKQLEEFAGVKSKNRIDFQDFIKKWKGKNIKDLTKKEIADNLRGFTNQANKVADLVENGKFKFSILEESEFKQAYLDARGDPNKYSPSSTQAFSVGQHNYFRNTKTAESFLSEIVHEGTHTIDYMKKIDMYANGKSVEEVFKILGNRHSHEKRAFFHEMAFQGATGMEKDFDSIQDMLANIEYFYDKI